MKASDSVRHRQGNDATSFGEFFFKATFAAVIRHSCMQLYTCHACRCAREGQNPQFHSIPLTLLGQLMSWQQSKMGHVIVCCPSHGKTQISYVAAHDLGFL